MHARELRDDPSDSGGAFDVGVFASGAPVASADLVVAVVAGMDVRSDVIANQKGVPVVIKQGKNVPEFDLLFFKRFC
jgi:hypothetical protein